MSVLPEQLKDEEGGHAQEEWKLQSPLLSRVTGMGMETLRKDLFHEMLTRKDLVVSRHSKVITTGTGVMRLAEGPDASVQCQLSH